MRAFAAVDLGATSGRVILGLVPDVSHLAEEASIELSECARFPNGPVTGPDGRLHWDLPRLWEGVVAGLAEAGRRAAARGLELSGIGVDTWAVDYGLFGQHDEHLLAPARCYRDPRYPAVAEEVREELGAQWLFQANGLQHLPFNTAYQLVAEAAAPAVGQADGLLLIPDVINLWLTGRRVAEVTNASTTGLLDPQTRRWSPSVLEALAALRPGLTPLLGNLPPLVEPGHVLGPLGPWVQGRTGLGPVPVIAVASHDTASAVVGAPLRAGSAYISSGTWSLVGVELDAPILSAAAREAGFTNELGADGTVRFLKNVAGLWVFDECRRQWEREGTPQPLAELLAQTAAQPPSARVIDLNGPQFLPPGDMPARVREAARAEGLAADHPAQAARLVLDSLAHAYAAAIRQAGALTGSPIREVVVVGGGSQNRLLNHLTAAATGLPVVAGPVEAAALGNVLIQARAVGGGGQTLTELRSLTTPNPSQR